MPHRGNHVLANAEFSDPYVGGKRLLPVFTNRRYFFTNSVVGFFQPPIAAGEGLMPRHLKLDTFSVQEASHAPVSLSLDNFTSDDSEDDHW